MSRILFVSLDQRSAAFYKSLACGLHCVENCPRRAAVIQNNCSNNFCYANFKVKCYRIVNNRALLTSSY